MTHLAPRRVRRTRSGIAATSLLCAFALTLAGCGSDDTSDGSASTGSDGSTGSAAASGGDSALDTLMQPVDSYTLPTEKVDVSSLSGKTIYYIPITQQTPAFTATSDAMSDALAAVGMKLQICDGGANPSSTSACISQAVGAGAAGIVTDSIPYGFAANALADAQSKGVPVLITDQIEDPEHPASKDLAYMTGPGVPMLEAIARWVIQDSGGKAVVVANEVTDNPSSIAYMDAAVKVFKDECPDCTVEVNQISAANFAQVAPATAAAINKTPGVNYVLSEFDAFLQATYGGMQSTGKASSIKLVSTAATLSSLQAMGKSQPPVADVGQSLPFQGWVDADAILRLIQGQEVPEYDIPIRLFDATNIGDVDATDAAAASGEWYGPTDFADQFKSLWGVS